MPRATRQSQSQAPGPSQPATQTPRGYGRQGRGRAARVEEVDSDDEPRRTQTQTQAQTQGDEDGDGDEDDEMNGAGGGGGNDELTRKSNDLVRLALFTEQRRVPLRRDEISKKILSQNPRAFNTVFQAAQQKLRATFGMELVELPTRAALDQEAALLDEELEEARGATGIRRKVTGPGSKTYILRSTLPAALIELSTKSDNAIFEEELGDKGLLYHNLEDDDASEEDGERLPKDHGSIISWSKCDQLGAVGVLYVVLGLVLVSGRSIPDADLRRYLTALHLPFNKDGISTHHPIHYTTSATTRAHSMEDFLSSLLKQNYLDRIQVGGDNAAQKKGKKGAASSKRLRTQGGDEDDGRTYEWRWGSRAFCEVGEEMIGRFVGEFMCNVKLPGDGEQEEGEGEASEEMVNKMMQGIEKAAGGGKLTEIRG